MNFDFRETVLALVNFFFSKSPTIKHLRKINEIAVRQGIVGIVK